MKKAVTLILAMIMIMSANALLYAADESKLPFSDVTEDRWFYDSVKFVYENNIMEGTEKDKFLPSGNLTRAMFVTILCRMDKGEEKETSDFSDVPSGKWFSGYVGWAAEKGVVNGYDDGTFRPNANISRQELAAALVRYIESTGKNLPRRGTAPGIFADEESIGSWAKEYVETLRRAGIINGDNKEKYNPRSYVTRAETATIIMNLISTEELAWQGYLPDPEEDGFAVYGAKYLYTAGNALQEKLAVDLSTDDAGFPVLDYYDDGIERESELTAVLGTHDSPRVSWDSYEYDKTVGISPISLLLDLRETPFLKICYTSETPLKSYMSEREGPKSEYRTTNLTFESGEEDAGYSTAICDLSDAVNTFNPTFGTDTGSNIHIMFEPYADSKTNDFTFSIRYYAFFSTKEEAEKFSSSEYEDYLKNYFLYSDSEVTEIDDKTTDEYIDLIRDKIFEIKNSKSAVTPEDIEKAGGKCYYVSSINGNDSNDGLSPDRPIKSISKLFIVKAGGLIEQSVPQSGDGVFFERGSEFYPWKYYNNTISNLTIGKGVTYGAYGDPSLPKPVFYGSFDFGGGTGKWEETEWDDIYVINLKEYLPDSLTEERLNHFAGYAGDIGSIIFNEGQYMGVKVFPIPKRPEGNDYPESVFGEDKTTYFMYKRGNCDEYFLSGGTSCKNPGDALRNNLEYIHDYAEGKIYLRCKWGNPSEYFDRIDLCRNCNIAYAGGAKRLDNLCFLYSGYIGADIGAQIEVTWCESGYCGGGPSSVGTGIGGFGGCEYILIDHCYIHDVEDGPMGTQSAEEGNIIKNVVLTNNVVTTSQNLVELFNTYKAPGEDGLGVNKIINSLVENNYGLYIGYGYPRFVEPAAQGLVLHNWYYGEMVNCIFRKNTVVLSAGSIIGASVASDNNPRGWYMYSNTYVSNPEFCSPLRGTDGTTFTNLNESFLAAYKMRYDDRHITYLTSIGIENGSKYYSTYIASDAELDEFFITNSYYIERGIKPH